MHRWTTKYKTIFALEMMSGALWHLPTFHIFISFHIFIVFLGSRRLRDQFCPTSFLLFLFRTLKTTPKIGGEPAVSENRRHWGKRLSARPTINLHTATFTSQFSPQAYTPIFLNTNTNLGFFEFWGLKKVRFERLSLFVFDSRSS